MAQTFAAGRRAMLGGSAAVLFVGAVAAPSAEPAPDAELVRACHAFAEAEWRSWWSYVVAPADLADVEATDPDWSTVEYIETTPAMTPAGWAAKALALAAWHREADDDADCEGDASATLLAGLLRDMVAPARAAILARCAVDYGPLPDGYTADARWIGQPLAAAAPLLPLPHLDADLHAACAAYAHAEAEVARLERTAADDVFEPAVAALHAAAERVSGLRAHTVGGLRAKATVCRAVLAADEPAAMAGRFGDRAQRHDVLAWSTLRDLVEVTA